MKQRRILVYSHDTFGLGNIRRMLAICEHLIETDPDLTVLLITGSPVIHCLRLPSRLDYIKLPCLTRTDYEGYDVKCLGTEIGETVRLRSDLILSAVANFKPDLFLIDKKPYGVKNELMMALNYAQLHLPESKRMLVLRDILDSPQRTVQVWRKNGFCDAIRLFYDRIFVMGAPEVFDLRREYELPADVAEKVGFCGYLRRKAAIRPRAEVRADLRIGANERLVLVTPGGGQDGFEIISTFLDSLDLAPQSNRVRSLLVCGPEMPQAQKEFLYRAAAQHPQASICEFTDDPMSLMNAADVVVSMGGYNTVCELLSLKKRAIVIPRARPSHEQLIRAERMAARGLFSFIHPDHLTALALKDAVSKELSQAKVSPAAFPGLDMDALPRLAEALSINERAESECASIAINLSERRAVAGAFI
jgi:predicted glycosyltransferase